MVKDVTKFKKCHLWGRCVLECVCVCGCVQVYILDFEFWVGLGELRYLVLTWRV